MNETPDAVITEATIQEPIAAESIDRFPCPQCGADMAFSPEAQSLGCPYCGHQVELTAEIGDVKEYDLAEGEKLCSTDWGQQTKTIHCQNCGAQTVLDANNTAQTCSFCGSAHIVKQEEIAGIKPETIIPFKVTAKEAERAFTDWIGKRFFAPSDLKTSYSAERTQGVYIPFWTYDSDTYSLYRAQRGDHYWVTEHVTVVRNGKHVRESRQVRKTRWRHVSGTYAKYFDDELVHASERLDGIFGGRVGHFDLTQLVQYRPEYLSGFVAEKYSIGLKQGWERARESIRQKISQGITRKIGGDEVRFLNFTTSFDRIAFKHTLLPLWMAAYTYKGKVYRFLVNGQTGEVHGEAPVSAFKVGVCVAAAIAVILAIYFLASGQA